MNLIEDITSAEARKRAEALEFYRAVLLMDSPRAKDRERLHEAMRTLGRSVEVLIEDQRMFRRIHELETAEPVDADQVNRELNALNEQLDGLSRKCTEEMESVKHAWKVRGSQFRRRRDALLGQLQRAEVDATELERMNKRFAEAFGRAR